MTSEKYCLAIETTGSRLGLSLHKWSRGPFSPPIAVFFAPAGHRQSEMLIPTLERLLKSQRRNKRSIGWIAVDTGPGSFTGVRVGVAAARTLAQALRVPLAGVSSLEAMALASARRRSEETIVSCLPAQPGELYFAVYRPEKKGPEIELRGIVKPCWRKMEELAKLLKDIHGPAHIVVESWNDELRKMARTNNHFSWAVLAPHPDAIAAVAMRRFGRSPTTKRFPYENVLPIYLQPSWAERTKNAGAAS